MKLGYHFWISSNTSAADVQQSDGWGRLRRICVPHKIRVLLWRLCRNTVPIRNQLRGKEIYVPINFLMCTGDVEHLLHLFFDCSFANSCWNHMGLHYDTRDTENAPEWFLDKLST